MVPSFLGLVSEHYTLLRKIGHGSFGVVYEAAPKQHVETAGRLCARPPGQRVAIKMFDLKGPSDQKPGWRDRIVNMFLTEVEVGRRCDHPNLVRLLETFEHYDGNDQPVELATVMELCEGGDLLDVVVAHPKGMPLEMGRKVLFQLCLGLRHLHAANYVHRDLKLENVFFLSGDHQVVKIGDFGSVVRSDGPMVRSRGGSPSYLPPEVWRSLGWNQKGDAWALGVVAYAVLVGSMPFPQPAHVGTNATMSLVVKGDANYTRSAWSNLVRPAQDMVKSLLQVNGTTRSSVKEVLHHAFYQDLEPPPQRAWQLMCSLAAFQRMPRLQQLLCAALAASLSDLDIHKDAVKLWWDLDQGNGTLGTARELATKIRRHAARDRKRHESEWEWFTNEDLDASEFECLAGRSYSEFIAIMFAKPDLWFANTENRPKLAEYHRAVLRLLVSEQAVLTPLDLACWLPSSDWSLCSTVASEDDLSSEEGKMEMNEEMIAQKLQELSSSDIFVA